MQNKTVNNRGIIIAAGGSGSRYGSGNKLFELLGSIPLFVHTVRNFYGCCPDSNFIFVAPSAELERFQTLLSEFMPGNKIVFTGGGNSRGQSVSNGLAKLGGDVEFVAIHDAARPLSSAKLLMKCLDAATQFGGAVPAKPVTDTIKKAEPSGKIIETVDRSALWRVETPQVFSMAAIKAAYKQADGLEFTDDASVMEHAGSAVHVVYNPNNNLKITYPEDIKLLEFIKSKD
ncbi:MAG: 2-C-methyl-D-erythritol 4-phosphate cytidylyltransferase [Victivallaceae bacterium]